MKKYYFILSISFFLACTQEDNNNEQDIIDRRSYNLGIIGAFGEVVNAGVKKLALSEALPPEEMDKLMEEAQKIAERNHVLLYRESDLIITDLFPADVAKGKDVLLIYQGTTKDEYMALKAEAKALESSENNSAKVKTDIARRFGKMLSYPDRYINELMAGNGADTNAATDSSAAQQYR